LSEKLVQEIKQNPQLGYQFQGFINSKKIEQEIKDKEIDTLIIAEDLDENPELAQELYQCLPLKVDFIVLDRAYETFYMKFLLIS